jgi:hypothetical protein
MTRTAGMLRAYIEQRGFFARIAKQLGLDPFYVSRVAHGERHSPKISSAIEAELNKMQAATRKTVGPVGKTLTIPRSKRSPRVSR